MGRYMSKAEKAKMEADLKNRKEASTRRAAQRQRTEVGKAALAARGQKPATKRYDQMTAAEKAAYRAKTGRTQSLKDAKAAGDKVRKKRAADAAGSTGGSGGPSTRANVGEAKRRNANRRAGEDLAAYNKRYAEEVGKGEFGVRQGQRDAASAARQDRWSNKGRATGVVTGNKGK